MADRHDPPRQQRCRDPYPARRNRSNPLGLPQSPGANPLTGAKFYVPGPAHGVAAQAIVALTGLQPSSANETWGQYRSALHHGAMARRLAANAASPIGSPSWSRSPTSRRPSASRASSEAGRPGAVFAQVQKVFCDNLRSDPHSIPIINTDFLHGDLGGCPTAAKVRADRPTFERRVDEVAASTARRPAVYLLEIGAVGTSQCISAGGAMGEWETDLRYEIAKIAALPHTIVYVEGGYSDSNSPAYTARILNAIGIHTIRGFFTNDTHLNWTINEVTGPPKSPS